MNAIRSAKGESQKVDDDDKGAKAMQGKTVHTGFIAQEVEATAKKMNYDFDAVDAPKNGSDFYGIRYEEFVVPLVKAVQELSKQNTEKDAKIDDLQQQINELKTSMGIQSNQGAVRSKQVISIQQSGKLEQNQPNPTSQTTVIKYFIPEQASKAVIRVTNSNGQEIKSINLSAKGNGQVTLQTNSLVAGTYFYSLIADGKVTDTKQMIIAH